MISKLLLFCRWWLAYCFRFSQYSVTETERKLLVYGLCVTFKILVSASHKFCDCGKDYELVALLL
jgi:hypothetical protein